MLRLNGIGNISLNNSYSPTDSASPTALRLRLTQRRWRNGSAHHTSESNDRQRVGDHLDELRWNRVTALQLYLQCLGCSEQQARERGTNWIPSSEDNC